MPSANILVPSTFAHPLNLSGSNWTASQPCQSYLSGNIGLCMIGPAFWRALSGLGLLLVYVKRAAVSTKSKLLLPQGRVKTVNA